MLCFAVPGVLITRKQYTIQAAATQKRNPRTEEPSLRPPSLDGSSGIWYIHMYGKEDTRCRDLRSVERTEKKEGVSGCLSGCVA